MAKTPIWLRSLALSALAAISFSACSDSNGSSSDDSNSSSSTGSSSSEGFADAATLAARMGQGVNLGNYFEAPEWGSWGQELSADDFTKIAALGFKHVRIPVRWDAYAATTEPYTLDSARLDSMYRVVRSAHEAGLMVVLNQHHHDPIYADPTGEAPRLLAIWKQVAEKFKGEGDYLLFELLNEPKDNLDAAAWQVLFPQIIGVLRSVSPERTLVLGGSDWNSIAGMKLMELPADKNHLMLTFHYYSPYQFTHQGAEWSDGSDAWLGTTWNGMEDEQAALKKDLQSAADWAAEHGVPVYMGEFGAYSKADTTSRALWTEFVSATAQKLGMPAAYWEWSAGFGLYDKNSGTVVEYLRKALLSHTIDWSKWPVRPDLSTTPFVLIDDFENTHNDSALTPDYAARYAIAQGKHPDSSATNWYLYSINTSNWSMPGIDTIYTNARIDSGAVNNLYKMFSASGYAGKGIQAALHLLGESYPWAGFGIRLNPACSCTVDLSGLQAITFMAKGTGSFRVKVGTLAAADTTLADNWGNFETSIDLQNEWTQVIIWPDMLKASPYSALESSSHTWATASAQSTVLEFMAPQLGSASADEKSEIFVDDIRIYGISESVLGLK